MIVDIVAVAFGEAINKNRAFLVSKGEEDSITARASLPLPCDALFDDAAAKIGVNQSLFDAADRLA